MLKKTERLLPHAAILICNMYVVFYLIDRVNPAMNFIDNGLTKGLLLILCVIALINDSRLLLPLLQRRRAPARRSGNAASARPAQRQAEARYSASNQGYRGASSARYNVATYDRRAAGNSREGYPRRTAYEREGNRR